MKKKLLQEELSSYCWATNFSLHPPSWTSRLCNSSWTRSKVLQFNSNNLHPFIWTVFFRHKSVCDSLPLFIKDREWDEQSLSVTKQLSLQFVNIHSRLKCVSLQRQLKSWVMSLLLSLPSSAHLIVKCLNDN